MSITHNGVDDADRESDLDYVAWYDEDCESVDTAEAMRLEAEAMVAMVDAIYTVPDILRKGLIAEFLLLMLPVNTEDRDIVLAEIVDFVQNPIIKKATAEEAETFKAVIRND